MIRRGAIPLLPSTASLADESHRSSVNHPTTRSKEAARPASARSATLSRRRSPALLSSLRALNRRLPRELQDREHESRTTMEGSSMSAPPFAYYGGKTKLADRIVQLLPEHEHYVEPFAGSLAVLLAKPKSSMETVNDIDGDLMTFWRVLRDQPNDLIRACALTPHSRAEHASAYADTDSDLERARRVWVQLAQGRAGTRRKTGWRHYVAPRGSASMPKYLDGYVDRIAGAAERLHDVSLESRPAIELVERYGRDSEVLLYCDPPYLASTRGWGNNYKHEMRSDAEHEQMAAALLDCKASVVVSGYPSPLYESLFDGWHRVELAAWTGNGIREGATKTDGDRVEVLWSNRPLGQDVLDFGESA